MPIQPQYDLSGGLSNGPIMPIDPNSMGPGMMNTSAIPPQMPQSMINQVPPSPPSQAPAPPQPAMAPVQDLSNLSFPTPQTPAPVIPSLSPSQGIDTAAQTIKGKSDLDTAIAGTNANASAAMADNDLKAVQDLQLRQHREAEDQKAISDRQIELENRRRTGIEDLMNSKIDIHRGDVFHSKDTGAKVMAGIGVMLGGIGQGAAGIGGHSIPNYALDKINKAITDDIDAQKEDINNHYKGLVEAGKLEDSEQSRAEHKRVWENDYQTRAWQVAQRMTKNIADQTQSPVIKANAQKAMLDANNQIAQLGVQKSIMLANQQAAMRDKAMKLQKEADERIAAQRDKLMELHKKDQTPYSEAQLDRDLSESLPHDYQPYEVKADWRARNLLAASGVKTPTPEQIAQVVPLVRRAVPPPSETKPVAGLQQQEPTVTVEREKMDKEVDEKAALVRSLAGKKLSDKEMAALTEKGIPVPGGGSGFIFNSRIEPEAAEKLAREIEKKKAGGSKTEPPANSAAAIFAAGKSLGYVGK